MRLRSLGFISTSTTAASQGEIVQAVTATGTVNPVVIVQVGSYVSGPIVQMLCDFSTEVKKGQLCAQDRSAHLSEHARPGGEFRQFESPIPDRTFWGEVAQVRQAPITVQNVVTYDVVITVSNRELLLKAGKAANTTVVVAEREHALRVPLQALRFAPEGTGQHQKTHAAKPSPIAPRTCGYSRMDNCAESRWSAGSMTAMSSKSSVAVFIPATKS